MLAKDTKRKMRIMRGHNCKKALILLVNFVAGILEDILFAALMQ